MKKPDRLFHSPGPCYPSGPGESPLNYHLIQDTPIGDFAIVYRAAPFFVHRIFLPNALIERWKSTFFENGCTHPESSQLARCILDYLQGNSAFPGPVPWHRLYLMIGFRCQVSGVRWECLKFKKPSAYSA